MDNTSEVKGKPLPGVSVVIPNYNGAALMEDSLPYLLAALRACGRDFEIIIADNASTDASVEFIKKSYPEVLLIEGTVNAGFSVNINRGIARATKPLCFLMSTDIRLTPDYFARLFPCFSAPDVFGVMGRIIGYDDEIVQDSAKYPRWNGLQVNGSSNYLPASGTRAPSLFLSGAEALVDTAKLKSIGGFDEAFTPFYGEDLDLGLRAWRSGWTCWYEHASVCRHRTSSTINKYNKPFGIRSIAARNKFQLHFIHLDLPSLLLWLPVVAVNLLFKTLSFKFYYLNGFRLFLGGIGRAAASRKKAPRVYTLRQAYARILALIEEAPKA